VVILKIHPERVLGALGSANPAYLALALALTVPFLYLKTLRWHAMLEAAGVNATFGEAALSLVAGMGLALVTPARLGEIARAAYLRDSQKLKIAGLVMVDKAFDVLVLVILSITGAWALIGPWAGAGFLLTGACAIVIAFRPRSSHRLALRLTAGAPWSGKIDRVLSSLEVLSPISTSLFLLLTTLSFAVVLVQFGLILLSWKAWSLGIVFLTLPLVILTNVLPITIGGLGVREGVAALLLVRYGVSPAHAALAAFLMFLINTALPGLVGAVLTPALPSTPPASTSTPNLERP
jgi:uncharacterized membrane protein YbhN (UPF0104 family)